MHHHHRVHLAEGAVHCEVCCAPERPNDGLDRSPPQDPADIMGFRGRLEALPFVGSRISKPSVRSMGRPLPASESNQPSVD